MGTTITLEAWDNKYKPNQDWNHAWGAAPANIIPRCLMGIQPLEPGFAKVRIKPQVGSLTKGSFDQPTVRGTIHADFQSVPGESFVLNVSIPANVEATVYLPRLDSPSAAVTVDGRTVQGTAAGRFVAIETVGSGSHHFERRR